MYVSSSGSTGISMECIPDIQGQRVSEARNKHEAGSKQLYLAYSSTLKMQEKCLSGTLDKFC
jgi:hypothetical protein